MYRRFELYELSWGLWAIGLGVAVLVLGVYLYNRMAKGRIFDPDGLYRSPHTVRLTDTHPVTAVRNNKYTYAYGDMLRVEENRAYVYAFIDTGAALYIPTTAFESEKSKRQFIRDLSKRVKATARARGARRYAGRHKPMALTRSAEPGSDRRAKWTRRFFLSLTVIAILTVPGYFYTQAKFDETWGARVNAMREKVCAAITGDCLVKFSAYDEDMLGLRSLDAGAIFRDQRRDGIETPLVGSRLDLACNPRADSRNDQGGLAPHANYLRIISRASYDSVLQQAMGARTYPNRELRARGEMRASNSRGKISQVAAPFDMVQSA